MTSEQERHRMRRELYSPDRQAVEAVLARIRDQFDFGWTADVLPFFFQERKETLELVHEILRHDPVFHFERRPSFVRPPRPAPRDGGPPLAGLFSTDRISRLSRAVKDVPDEVFASALPRFAEIPGVDNLDPGIVFSGSKSRFRPRFRVLRERYFSLKYRPQVSVVPTYACPMGCSFCFAKGLAAAYPRDMSLDTFRGVLDAVIRGMDVRTVNFLGGEPTGFPQFVDFLDEAARRGLDFYFATNGLARPKAFSEILARDRLISVTFHVERDEFYSESQRRTLRENIRACGERKILAVLRANLAKPEVNDWTYLLEYSALLQRGAVSLAIPFPSKAGPNTYVPISELRGYAASILGFALAMGGLERSFPVVLAKPFPPCFFDLPDLPVLLRRVQYKNVCELDKNEGLFNVCVNPDVSAFPCMALNSTSDRTASVLSGDGWRAAHRALADRLTGEPVMPECAGCRLHASGVCQAACYAYL